ncbi:hypothetical protein [Planomonospora venezuelensis]|uniref:Uncharacterized protein n=1 Tax=Planomonospora venezuelensis TaxID=1999 RepID=A0A841DHE1_PLAVE|nr:hypothetical protein [Planomonospora venezuelensis]MBB5967728.1 hypothetical protein [Planomonospora venezuelensis]GIN03742.1 hypothetical protein Pve01_54000 [Planomonospora venezuelensis]
MGNPEHQQRGVRRALFHRDGTTYAPVPGGEVRAGFGPARFTPAPEQAGTARLSA